MYLEKTIANMNELAKSTKNATEAIKAMPHPGAAAQGSTLSTSPAPAKLDPQAVAMALAEALRSNNSTTQQIAIRAGNLAAKYPQRAA
jgi:hypothetical protein